MRSCAPWLLLACTLASASDWAASPARPGSLEECHALLRSQPGEKETAFCFYQLAKPDGPGDAREMADRALSRLASAHPDLPWFTYYSANLRYSDAAEAEVLYRRSAAGFQKSGDIEGEVYSRISRSKLLARIGREEEARGEMERFLELTAVSDDPRLRAWGQIELVRQLLRTGRDLGHAYTVLRQMAASAPLDEEYSMRRERLLLLGNVCIQVGRLDEGRRILEELAEITATADDRFTEASARYNLAAIAFEKLGDSPTEAHLQEARALAARALEVATLAKNRAVEAKAAWLLGTIAPATERDRYFERCLAAAPAPELRSCCLAMRAARLVRTDPPVAREHAERALALAEGAGQIWSRIIVLRAWMRLQWETAGPQAALGVSWDALDTLETLRERQSEGSEIQAGVFSVWSDDYAWWEGRLLESIGSGADHGWATTEAFLVSERRRARALTDWLREADPSSAGTEAIEFSGLAEVQASLEPREALLSFQVAPWDDLAGDFGGGSWLLAVTRDAVTVHRLPGRVVVRRVVDQFNGLIERRDGSEAGLAARLYEELLGPALAALPPEVDRLVLIPDDALHRLPFGALRASADAEPVGAGYELVQVPSATLWLRWREALPTVPGRPLLVLADPDSPEAGGDTEEADVEVARVRAAARSLGRLPHARREGRAAVRALGEGLLLVGAEASEARLATLPLGDFGVLHLAAHALTDEDRPERSAVLLTPGGGQDGLLRSAEIAGLDLAGRTAVLASCRSASGTVLRGEGVMSLARAFFQAGAHGVVASLWPLRDDESAALFGRFYRHLAGGASVAEALHRARREAIEAGEPAAAWAGLVVLGDGAVVPLPEGGDRPPLLRGGWSALGILLGLALAAGAAAAWRLRPRRT